MYVFYVQLRSNFKKKNLICKHYLCLGLYENRVKNATLWITLLAIRRRYSFVTKKKREKKRNK